MFYTHSSNDVTIQETLGNLVSLRPPAGGESAITCYQTGKAETQ